MLRAVDICYVTILQHDLIEDEDEKETDSNIFFFHLRFTFLIPLNAC